MTASSHLWLRIHQKLFTFAGKASTMNWTRPKEGEYLAYQYTYITRVPDGDLLTLFAKQMQETVELYSALTPEQLQFAYAEGKWTVQEVLQHIIDCERVMTYRAMRFARKDTTPLPGFDENLYVETSGAMQRSITDMLIEFQAVRAATIAFFKSCSADMLQAGGIANNGNFTVNAYAWILVGHELHHRAILHERYAI